MVEVLLLLLLPGLSLCLVQAIPWACMLWLYYYQPMDPVEPLMPRRRVARLCVYVGTAWYALGARQLSRVLDDGGGRGES